MLAEFVEVERERKNFHSIDRLDELEREKVPGSGHTDRVRRHMS